MVLEGTASQEVAALTITRTVRLQDRAECAGILKLTWPQNRLPGLSLGAMVPQAAL